MAFLILICMYLHILYCVSLAFFFSIFFISLLIVGLYYVLKNNTVNKKSTKINLNNDFAFFDETQTYSVSITAVGNQKIKIIRLLRDYQPSLELHEANDLLNQLPLLIVDSTNRTTAKAVAEKLHTLHAACMIKNQDGIIVHQDS